MTAPTEAEQAERSAPWWKRLAWLAAIWALSVVTLGAAAWVLKALMRWAGLAT